MHKIVVLFFLCVVLAACATLPPPHSAGPPKTLAAAHQQNFRLAGVLAYRTKDDAGSLHWQWQQQGNNWTLRLTGPLGAGGVRIHGHPGQVWLETAEGKKRTASSPEKMLAEETGWQIPVSRLFACLRSMPQGKQGSWTVAYQHVTTTADNILLPDRLLFVSQDISIRVVTKRWEFGVQ